MCFARVLLCSPGSEKGPVRSPQHNVTVRRTVFIRDIDQEVRQQAPSARALRADSKMLGQVSEEQVLHVFSGCGTIVDSRMCGDPNSALRFAFVEFDSEEAVSKVRVHTRGAACSLLTASFRPQALGLSGAVMGSYSIKVVRSKTAIVPVNASLLPRTEEEHERCKRTVYVTNIDLGVEVRRCAQLVVYAGRD